MASPQTVYTGAATTQPVPITRVYFDGATTLATNDIVCYDLSVGDGKTVAQPVTADLDAVAGIYTGAQGGSVSTAQFIDIVPAGSGAVVTVNCTSGAFGDGTARAQGVIASTGTHLGKLAVGDGNAARAEAGYVGIAVGNNGTTTTPSVLLN